MPKLNVSRSIAIDAPASKIFSHLNNFNNWTAWSPWLLMNPKAKVTVAEDAKYYEWEGERVGSGNMKVLKEDENEFIDYDLNFLKPWKSHANTNFTLKENDGKTEVTWVMDSSLPFFLFFMKKMMEGLVGGDYERGLTMLKSQVENGKVNSKLDWQGISELQSYSWVGIKSSTTKDQLAHAMMADFDKLGDYGVANAENLAGDMFSIYHKWDIASGQIEYTSGMPVKAIPSNLPAGFVTGIMPASKIYTLRHTGEHKHLGNAWSTMYNMKQNKEFKIKKGFDPFEVYRNDPASTAPADLITDVVFAVK